MSIEIIQGDLLDAFDKGDVNIIAHCVNCQGVMGSGIAKSIKDRYPKVFNNYYQTTLLYNQKRQNSPLLGVSQIVYLNNGRYIFNLFGQNAFGNKRDLDYGAISRSLIRMADGIVEYNIENCVIGFPYLMGCDRAGGDWTIVSEMIEFIFKEFEVKFYKLN